MRGLAVDVVGLCLTARNADYVKASLAGWDDDGPCTAIGHARTLSAAGAAFVNGTAAHGEDFDDTFEGGPVHAGAVIVPAVLAACERHHPDGRDALLGIAVGAEVMCRLSLVAPKRTHKAGFHPTAIFGAMGAAAGVAAALRLTAPQTVDALGIAGSMASGIIEYLAEGAWTKRMHAGWAAQSGMRAALLARARLPRTAHRVRGHARSVPRLRAHHRRATTRRSRRFRRTLGDRDARLQALSVRDHDASLHRLRAAARASASRPTTSREMVCEIGEGTVHRLWEPLAAKQQPANGYAGKFSTPYCIAAAFVHGNVGLDAFTDDTVHDDRRHRAGHARCATRSIRRTRIRGTSPATSA